MEHRVARRDPVERRQPPVAARAEVRRDLVDEVGRRKDAPRSEKTVDLDPERDERREIDEAENPQEEGARDPLFARRGLRLASVRDRRFYFRISFAIVFSCTFDVPS
jgi:hypothetical protein